MKRWLKFLINCVQLFSVSIEGILRSFWFCCTSLCAWFKNLAHLFLPIRIRTKTKWRARTRFPALGAGYMYLHVFDWFIVLFASAVIRQSNNFGFGLTTLIWKPLYPGTLCRQDLECHVILFWWRYPARIPYKAACCACIHFDYF